jgi:hypothetical protein
MSDAAKNIAQAAAEKRTIGNVIAYILENGQWQRVGIAPRSTNAPQLAA